jgi:hypothetical protein
MSHELRTPLNAIIGLTEMMVTNAARFGAEKALEPLRRVNAAESRIECQPPGLRHDCGACDLPSISPNRVWRVIFIAVPKGVAAFMVIRP